MNGRDIVLHGREVRVHDKEGHYIVWMVVEPIRQSLQLRLPCSCIQKVAGGVAVVDGVVHPVGLALKHANAVVELVDYR